MRKDIKRKFGTILFLIIISLWTACEKEGNEEKQEIFDIKVTTEKVFSNVETEDYYFLGTQYYNGERVQLWVEKPIFMSDGVTLKNRVEVFLHREDGSRKKYMTDVFREYVEAYTWWLDEQGNCFFWNSSEIGALDENGKELFRKHLLVNMEGICQVGNDTVVVLYDVNGNKKLAELNPVNGNWEEKMSVDVETCLLAGGRDSVFLLGYQGCCEIDWETGNKSYSIWWEGTTYNWISKSEQKAFRVWADNSIEILYSDGYIEKLEMVQVDTNKKIITVRSGNVTSWLKNQVIRFNQSDTDYYVVLEEKNRSVDEQTFLEQTDIELVTGHGADIVMDSAMNNSYSLWTKGSFEDLQPFMEKSGLAEEDFFPYTFSQWADGTSVYGVNLLMRPRGMWINAEFLENETYDIEGILLKMKQYERKAVFQEGYTEADIVNFFLQGSEDLWGMVCWEEHRCDFHTTLFRDILEVAKKYGDDGDNDYDSLTGFALVDDFHSFTVNSYRFEKENKVLTGYLFDKGCFMYLIPEMVAINADSLNKEGAWEFIAFLLSDEAQSEIGVSSYVSGYPVNRKVFESLQKQQLDSDVSYILYTLEFYGVDIRGLSKEQLECDRERNMEKLSEILEETSLFPVCTQPILDIIYEETSEYFSGVKSLEEVIAVIENRVQLYLDEIS